MESAGKRRKKEPERFEPETVNDEVFFEDEDFTPENDEGAPSFDHA